MLSLAPRITGCGVCNNFIHFNSSWCLPVHIVDVSSKGWVGSKMFITFVFEQIQFSSVILTPDRWQSETLILSTNVDKKIVINRLFDCHLSQDWRQIENIVSIYFWTTFVNFKSVFDYRISGVILVNITLEKKEMMITRCINVMGRACITTIVSDLWVIAIPSDDVITINSISKVTTWNLDD